MLNTTQYLHQLQVGKEGQSQGATILHCIQVWALCSAGECTAAGGWPLPGLVYRKDMLTTSFPAVLLLKIKTVPAGRNAPPQQPLQWALPPPLPLQVW